MDLFHRKKNICDQCGEKFESYDELIKHSRQVHHHPIVKCQYCGKEFIHEKDRLHHSREEHQKELEYRTHREGIHTQSKIHSGASRWPYEKFWG